MSRRERAYLRRSAREYAYRYLGVKRLPAGVPALVRAYADGFTTYPEPSLLYEGPYVDPFAGLARWLTPYRKLPNLV